MSFYLPYDPAYTLLDSVRDSARFVTEKCITSYRGHACCTSSFVKPDGEIMHWHDFGDLEGPGWAANAVGGARELLALGRRDANPALESLALSLLDHVLDDGFVDFETGFIQGYRDIAQERLCLNFKHNNDWFCPGSMAKVGFQLLHAAKDVEPLRAARMWKAGEGCLGWIRDHVRATENGWYPRRCTPDGSHYPQRAEGGPDPFQDSSADGLFILLLQSELAAAGQGDLLPEISERCDVFVSAGGFFGSINHDTYDATENVAYSVAFRALLRCGRVLERPDLVGFAYDRCLATLDRFKMCEDRNGVRTRGLLWMEPSWDTSYLWEDAEAALAYLEAYQDRGSEAHLRDAVTLLRACALHHHGEFGFLTEGVDWNNHVGRQHHFDNAEFGDIQYTEPLLNNLHIAEPTLLLYSLLSESEIARV